LALRASTSLSWRLGKLAERLRVDREEKTLAGDRDLEWAWCLAHLPHSVGRVLDFGAGHGLLSAGAALRGNSVVSVDLEPCEFPFELDAIEYRQGDFTTMELEPRSFDFVLNCSTIEHVGLSGRYSGSEDDADADLRAMEKLASLLKPDGAMALTIPVGRDAVFSPFHRVYGPERLERLLAPFTVVAERFLTKPDGPRWQEVDRATALAEQGSPTYYALGLFRLTCA
jgi:2-polyprenyl-3-methyl-5-hydroxy-6-metoxy-1,4-benzoquinol methylase